MKTRLHTWYRIWVMAVFGQYTGLVKGMSWLCGFAALIGAAAAMLVTKGDRLEAACAGAGFMLLILSNMWWSYFMSGAALQNSPANGKLVPGLTRTIRQVATLTWVVTIVQAMPFAYANHFSFAEVTLMVVGLTSLGMYMAGREAHLLAALLALLLYLLMKNFPLLKTSMATPAALVLAAGLCVAYVIYSLRVAFPQGGERHWKQVDRHRAVLSWQDMKSWEERGRRGGKNNVVYSWLLKRKCQAREGGAALMLDGLGARNNAAVTLVLVVFVVGAALLGRLLVELIAVPAEVVPKIIHGGLLIGPVIMAALAWSRFSTAIRSTPTEQSLLRLSPGMPVATELTPALARRLSVVCLAEWLACSVGMLIIIAAWGAERSLLQGAVAASAALLLLTSQPLENYAARSDGMGAGMVMLVIVMFFLLMAAFVMHDNFTVWLGLVAAMLAISLTYFAVRWFSMVRGPIAFPSGRMA